MAGPRDGLPRTVLNRPSVMGHGDRPPNWSMTWFGEAQNSKEKLISNNKFLGYPTNACVILMQVIILLQY